MVKKLLNTWDHQSAGGFFWKKIAVVLNRKNYNNEKIHVIDLAIRTISH